MKGHIQKNKKVLFVLLIAAIICLGVVIVSCVGKETKNSGNEKAFALSDDDLMVNSCSLHQRSGVSQGEPLVISFNQVISDSIDSIVSIAPEIEGSWSTEDKRLIFTPDKRWSPGTYYKVTLKGNTPIKKMGKVLNTDTTFSFETQDSSLRIPSSATFRVDKQEYFAGLKEPIVIDAAYTDVDGNTDTTATVKVWKFKDEETFIKKFTPLFSLPQWATISRSKTLVDTGNLQYMGKTDVPLTKGKIEYPSLPQGKYLLRLVVGGAAVDVAVTVDNTKVFQCYDGKYLYLWCNNDTQDMVGATVRIGTEKTFVDANGCAKITYNKEKSSSFPVLEITKKTDSHIIFLEDEDLPTPGYQGTLSADQSKLKQEGILSFSGSILPTAMKAVPCSTATVSLKNASGIMAEEKLACDDNGVFQGKFEKLSLPQGSYTLSLSENGNLLDEVIINAEKKDSPVLLVNQSENAVYNGDEITFRVRALKADGTPLVGAEIQGSGMGSMLTDAKGEARFYYQTAESTLVDVVNKVAKFQCTLVGQMSLIQSVSYDVVNKAGPYYTIKNGNAVKLKKEETDVALNAWEDKGQMRYFVANGKDFTIYPEPLESSGFAVSYDHGVYAIKEYPMANELSMELPEKLEVSAKEHIQVYPKVSGDTNLVHTAKLYQGKLPTSYYHETFRNQDASATFENSPIAEKTNSNGSFSFSAKSLSGDYFLAITAKSQKGTSITGYVPVTVTDGGILYADVDSYYPENQEIILPLGFEGKGLSYEVEINGNTVSTGQAVRSTTVSLGTYPQGTYEGAIRLWQGNTVIEEKPFTFRVYGLEPNFMTMTQKPTDKGISTYSVKEEDKDLVEFLFDVNLFPCNQLIDVLGRNELLSGLGKNSGFLSSYINYDFRSYQNPDGSFSRVVNGTGDVLLSCFVAGSADAIYNKEALKAFFLRKMNQTNDTEVMALSYWGLSLLGEAPLAEMTYHVGDPSFESNAKLYLAEAFIAAGDKATAGTIFNSVAKKLKKTDETYHYKDPEKNQSIFTALLTLDLSQKLHSQYTEGLLAYLSKCKLETQSNRYLMTLNLVNYLDLSDIILSDGTKEKGRAILSIVAQSPKVKNTAKGHYLANDVAITTGTVGQTMAFTLDWKNNAKKNALYMVYCTPRQNITLLENANTKMDHGHVMKLTMNTSTTIYFSPEEPGEDILGDIYILDVTTGKILAKGDLGSLAVSQ